MANETTLYEKDGWRILRCNALFGILKYEVENYSGGFWHSIFDAEDDLENAILFLYKRGIIANKSIEIDY